MSVSGLYLRIPQELEQYSEIEVEVQFSHNLSEGTTIQFNGKVLRSQPKPGMVYGVAVKVKKHKFLWK